MFYVSFFFIGTSTHMYQSKKNSDPLPPIKVDGEQKYEMDDILDSRIYNHQSNVLFIGMGMM